MISWVALENAIHAWIVAGTQLAATQVLWAGQGGPQPAGVYAVLRLSELRRVGHDWRDVVEVVDPDPGEELEHHVRGPRTLNLSIQVFGAPLVGASRGAALLERALTARALPSIAEALRAGGVGVGAVDVITELDGDRDGQFESRALVDVTIHVAADLVELGTYIERAEVENDVSDTTTWLPDPPP